MDKEGKKISDEHGQLTPEGQNRVVRQFDRIRKAGMLSRDIEPSLSGLDWDLYTTRDFPEHGNSSAFMDPPEFIGLAFCALDAYAAARLSCHISFQSFGLLTLTCKLDRRDPEQPMSLDFKTEAEFGRISSWSIAAEMLHGFPAMLKAKGITPGMVMLGVGYGCPMTFEYPGHMDPETSPFLNQRTVDQWPEAKLSFTPTEELRARSKEICGRLQGSLGDLKRFSETEESTEKSTAPSSGPKTDESSNQQDQTRQTPPKVDPKELGARLAQQSLDWAKERAKIKGYQVPS